ncbi:MAG: ribonuclease J [Candidatus Liptonbacteria bacterium]|nr:ribonuclease J [Candidatus Liptonbacteria bacterium]
MEASKADLPAHGSAASIRGPAASIRGPAASTNTRPRRERRPRPAPNGPAPRRGRTPARSNLAARTIPADMPAAGPLRFVPLGGLEEIGCNMMFFEYGNEIVAIDAGLGFPGEETPGIDYVIPNTSYLESKRANVRALIITHGHYDHIGAIPHIIEKIGNPPIYATALTKAIIEKRQADFRNSPRLKIITVKNGDKIKLSNHFSAEFFDIAHTIPDSTAVLLRTPVGNVVNLGDSKIERDSQGHPLGLGEYERIGRENILLFTAESTNADKPGHSESEYEVEKNLKELFAQAQGRIIVAMFASVLTRIGEAIKIAEKLGRRVALSGYSMKANVEIAKQLGYIKAHEGTLIPLEEIHKYPDSKLLILSTGAQGESNASLMKILNGEHRFVQIKAGDTVILSASVIPGNERSVQTVKDNLARQGAIIFSSDIVDIHASGHAPKEDQKLGMQLLKPKFLAPIHGYYYKRFVNAQNGIEAGISKENIFLLDNGEVAELTASSFRITGETVPASYVMVDGLGVGDVEEVVLRDRRNLAAEGMVVIITVIDRRTGRIAKNPDIISRGFIYLRAHQDLLEEIRKRLRNLMSQLPANQEVDSDYLKTLIRDQIGQYLFTRTRRRPMILPVVIEV